MKRWAFLILFVLLISCLFPVYHPSTVILGDQEISSKKFIVFIFFGHSNLDGMSLRQDNTVHPRCWALVDGKWIPATDRDLPFRPNYGNKSSCVYHFLKRMAADYPDYHFGAIKITGHGWYIDEEGSHMARGGIGYKQLLAAYQGVKDNITLGGMVAMMGMNAAKYGTPESRLAIKAALQKWVVNIREDMGLDDLSIILSRLEVGKTWHYRGGYVKEALEAINSMPEWDPKRRLVLAPRDIMPPNLYIDNDHYSWEGNIFFANEAVDIYQEKGLDSWCETGRRSGRAGTPPPMSGVGNITDDWPYRRDGLNFVWERGNVNNRIFTPEGELSHICLVRMRDFACYTRFFGMRTDGGAFTVMPQIANSIALGCKQSDQFSMEIIVTPRRETEAGAFSHIVAFGMNVKMRRFNFILAQEKKRLYLFLRTDDYLNAGKRVYLGELSIGIPQQIIVNYSPGILTYYRNGKRIKKTKAITGGLSPWTHYHLVFGQDYHKNGCWQGELEGVAIYSRVMEAAEVKARWRGYKKRIKGRKATERIEILVELVDTVDLVVGDDPYYVINQSYPRIVVHYAYEVREVLNGECAHKKILVAHWGAMDAKDVPSLKSRRKGQVSHLMLEPMADHPEISGERQKLLDDEDIDLPLYYDVSPERERGQ